MKKIFDSVKDNPLWAGIGYGDFEKMFNCIEARKQSYENDDIILMSGEPVHFVGLILSGSVKVIKEDRNGNAVILTELSVSELFGETFACAGIDHSPVTVQSAAATEVLFINYRKIITTCPSACCFHTRLIENMLRLVAKKNLMLNQKIDILSGRTTREKLLMFFNAQRGMATAFTLPYNREEMARYLCVDRSALSSELCRMRDEGLIRFNKNKFEIL